MVHCREKQLRTRNNARDKNGYNNRELLVSFQVIVSIIPNNEHKKPKRIPQDIPEKGRTRSIRADKRNNQHKKQTQEDSA